uniref:Uncharacterized protein n=1 Tax=Cucumis sativus TaxID=3659 RepID=A0A0A0LHV2_CUCSA
MRRKRDLNYAFHRFRMEVSSAGSGFEGRKSGDTHLWGFVCGSCSYQIDARTEDFVIGGFHGRGSGGKSEKRRSGDEHSFLEEDTSGLELRRQRERKTEGRSTLYLGRDRSRLEMV